MRVLDCGNRDRDLAMKEFDQPNFILACPRSLEAWRHRPHRDEVFAAAEEEVLGYPVSELGVCSVILVKPLGEEVNALLKQLGATAVQTSVQVIRRFDYLLTRRALVAQQILDSGHLFACRTPT